MKLFTALRTCVYAGFALLGIPLAWAWFGLQRRRPRRIDAPAKGQALRVAYVLTEISGGKPGGAASHKAGFCKGLQACGHKPVVLVSQPVPGLDKVVRDYHQLPPPELPRAFPLTLCVLANNLSFVRQACKILKTQKPNVVCQRQNQMNYAGALLSRLFKVPFILEYNSPANWKGASEDRVNPILGWIIQWVEQVNLRAADRIMVVSEVLKQRLVERGLPAARIAVNPNGADADTFRPDLDPLPVRQRLGLEGKIVVAFAGHNNSKNSWHGVKYLVMAVAKVVEKRPDVQFLFIGDQNLADLVTEIADPRFLKSAITFATNVPHPEMPNYYAACDILVSPHVHMADGSTFFGSPVKVFEYMAMGKAIVASGIGQLADLLKEKALLTPPGDVQAIANAILTLAGDPDLRRRLGSAVRETCLQRLTWKHNAERFIQACAEAQLQSQTNPPDASSEHPQGAPA